MIEQSNSGTSGFVQGSVWIKQRLKYGTHAHSPITGISVSTCVCTLHSKPFGASQLSVPDRPPPAAIRPLLNKIVLRAPVAVGVAFAPPCWFRQDLKRRAGTISKRPASAHQIVSNLQILQQRSRIHSFFPLYFSPSHVLVALALLLPSIVLRSSSDLGVVNKTSQ